MQFNLPYFQVGIRFRRGRFEWHRRKTAPLGCKDGGPRVWGLTERRHPPEEMIDLGQRLGLSPGLSDRPIPRESRKDGECANITCALEIVFLPVSGVRLFPHPRGFQPNFTHPHSIV